MTYEERLEELRLFSLKKTKLSVGMKITFKYVKSGCKQEENNQFPLSSGSATGSGEPELLWRFRSISALYRKNNCPFSSVYKQTRYNP